VGSTVTVPTGRE